MAGLAPGPSGPVEIEGARPLRRAWWRVWLKTARPFSLTATVSPLLVGTTVAVSERVFHPVPFALALISGLCLQTGTNFLNEYFDWRYGLDTAQSLGASTVIFTGEMTAGQVLGGGVGSFALATALGLALVALVGPAILLLGLAALTFGYCYSARPFVFAKRGLGDPLVFLAMGLLMTWGAYYVQRPRWSWAAFAASVPIGCLVVAILNMNNLRDYADDLAVGKRTLPVRFGMPFGRRYQAALMLGAYVALVVAVALGALPLLALLPLVTLPLAVGLARTVLRATDRQPLRVGMRRVSLLHLRFGAALALGLALAALLPLRL